MRNFVRKGVRAVGIDYFRDTKASARYTANPASAPIRTKTRRMARLHAALARSLNARPVFISAADVFVSALGAMRPICARLLSSPKPRSCMPTFALRNGSMRSRNSTDFRVPARPTSGTRPISGLHGGGTVPLRAETAPSAGVGGTAQGNPLRGLKLISAQTAEQLADHYRHTCRTSPTRSCRNSFQAPTTPSIATCPYMPAMVRASEARWSASSAPFRFHSARPAWLRRWSMTKSKISATVSCAPALHRDLRNRGQTRCPRPQRQAD